MNRLTGRKAFITGGASGMGRSIVQEFIQEGATVFAIDRDEVGLQGTVATLPTDSPVFTMKGDLAIPDEITRMTKAAVAAMGQVDIIVNNAALTGNNQHIFDVLLDDWRLWFAVNVTAHLLIAQALAPAMIARKDGAIVTIAAAASFTAGAGGITYTMTKHAVMGVVREMAVAFAKHNVRVNAVCPGMTLTPMMQTQIDLGRGAHIQSIIDATPVGRMAAPREMARAAVFLASEDASFMHGSAMMVDGGYTVV